MDFEAISAVFVLYFDKCVCTYITKLARAMLWRHESSSKIMEGYQLANPFLARRVPGCYSLTLACWISAGAGKPLKCFLPSISQSLSGFKCVLQLSHLAIYKLHRSSGTRDTKFARTSSKALEPKPLIFWMRIQMSSLTSCCY